MLRAINAYIVPSGTIRDIYGRDGILVVVVALGPGDVRRSCTFSACSLGIFRGIFAFSTHRGAKYENNTENSHRLLSQSVCFVPDAIHAMSYGQHGMAHVCSKFYSRVVGHPVNWTHEVR